MVVTGKLLQPFPDPKYSFRLLSNFLSNRFIFLKLCGFLLVKNLEYCFCIYLLVVLRSKPHKDMSHGHKTMIHVNAHCKMDSIL